MSELRNILVSNEFGLRSRSKVTPPSKPDWIDSEDSDEEIAQIQELKKQTPKIARTPGVMVLQPTKITRQIRVLNGQLFFEDLGSGSVTPRPPPEKRIPLLILDQKMVPKESEKTVDKTLYPQKKRTPVLTLEQKLFPNDSEKVVDRSNSPPKKRTHDQIVTDSVVKISKVSKSDELSKVGDSIPTESLKLDAPIQSVSRANSDTDFPMDSYQIETSEKILGKVKTAFGNDYMLSHLDLCNRLDGGNRNQRFEFIENIVNFQYVCMTMMAGKTMYFINKNKFI